MQRQLSIIIFIFASVISMSAKKTVVEPSFAWSPIPPLGLHQETTIDTLLLNYYQKSIPSAVSPAYATTGNLGSEGMNMLFFQREPMSNFFFRDALSAWMQTDKTIKFYNTRMPMTLLSYNTGGGHDNGQNRLSTVFSGNFNKRTQVGVLADYLYSKGSYENQATKDLTWGLSGSYMGDRYEFQGNYVHYNMLNKESGGIVDDLYITDPAEVQGGTSSVNPKSIPTRLANAHTRIVGGNLYMNHRYKVGYYHEDIVNDTTVLKTYVPVSSFIWTMRYDYAKHIFKHTPSGGESDFWTNTYLTPGETDDRTSYYAFTNTLGISMLEGFNKYAKAGLAAYVTHQIRHYGQMTDTITGLPELPEGLTSNPYPSIPSKATENLLWVGAQLTKQQGSILNYNATAELGLVGPAAGEIKIKGQVDTHIPLFGDTVSLSGYGHFNNVSAPYLMNHYVSNHFIWENDFGKTRSLRLGGILDIPFSRTRINAGVENIQNHIFFNSQCLPEQHSGSVQVVSATLQQNFKVGILNWDNNITYQTSTESSVIPLPKFAVYSNLYLLFKVAGVLHVQLGIDCDYYTKYKSVNYQPATMSFYNQQEIECGNYPFMNLYANMKLSKARFYVMMTHINQGMTGNNYFAMPHYPLNPRRFQMGVSIDFNN